MLPVKKECLEVLKPERLNFKQIKLLNSLKFFSAPYLEEKLLDEKKFGSKKEYQKVFSEFKKYVFLTQISLKKPLGMSSRKVDEIWHQFILFTPQYHQFCNDYLNGYLHHSPHTSKTSSSKKKEGARNFIKSYKELFGKIPKVWNIKRDKDPCDACGPDACAPDCGLDLCN